LWASAAIHHQRRPSAAAAASSSSSSPTSFYSSAAAASPAVSALVAAVADAVRTLRLEELVHNRVGKLTDAKSHLSGGQKKRVSIGMELVASPAALFLDEPTSGLDSATSFALVESLAALAREARIVVAAVIHSPSARTFELFDDLVLLVRGGRTIYSGSRALAREYFERGAGFDAAAAGAHAPDDAEFFLSIVQGDKLPLK
jgi:ABC-type multidrug transport system ATPase subunit